MLWKPFSNKNLNWAGQQANAWVSTYFVCPSSSLRQHKLNFSVAHSDLNSQQDPPSVKHSLVKLSQKKNICPTNVEVEDIVGALTPVVGGLAQYFHDILVNLLLLLVAEVEDGEKKNRQEEGWEIESGTNRIKERQPCMAWRSNLNQCEGDETWKEQKELRARWSALWHCPLRRH